jgi:hypothetical protein
MSTDHPTDNHDAQPPLTGPELARVWALIGRAARAARRKYIEETGRDPDAPGIVLTSCNECDSGACDCAARNARSIAAFRQQMDQQPEK